MTKDQKYLYGLMGEMQYLRENGHFMERESAKRAMTIIEQLIHELEVIKNVNRT